MKKVIIFICFAFILVSCQDIINTEQNIFKEQMYKKYSSDELLQYLDYTDIDFGTVKMMSVNNLQVSITNTSSSLPLTIFSLEGKNKSGLFVYSFPQGMPFNLQAGEDTKTSGKVNAKFIADVFSVGLYYDTLVINNNANFIIPVKVKVIY